MLGEHSHRHGGPRNWPGNGGIVGADRARRGALVLCAVATVLLAACGQVRGSGGIATTTSILAERWGEPLVPLAEGERHTDPRERFSLTIPRGWVAIGSRVNDAVYALPGATASLGIGLDPVGDPGVTLERVRAEYAAELRGRPDYALLRSDRILIDGQPAYREALRRTDDDGVLRIVRAYFIGGTGTERAIHVLTFSCLPEQEARWLPVFDGVIGSYRAGP